MDRRVSGMLWAKTKDAETRFSSWVLPTLALAYAIQFIIDTVILIVLARTLGTEYLVC